MLRCTGHYFTVLNAPGVIAFVDSPTGDTVTRMNQHPIMSIDLATLSRKVEAIRVLDGRYRWRDGRGNVCTAIERAGAALAAAVPAIVAPVASATPARPVAHAFFVLAEIVMKYNLS